MPIKKSAGFSLVELMVALALGLLVVFAMVYVFANSSKSYSELQKAAQQIENGRLAINLIAEDVRDAGQFGDFVTFPPLLGAPVIMPVSDPAPCPAVGAADFLTDLRNAVPLPVQGYDNVSSLPGGLTNCLTSSAVAAVVANSDILVVRRGDTVALVDPEGSQSGTGVALGTATPVEDEVYIQTNPANFEIQKGGTSSIDKNKTAGGGTASVTRRDFTSSPPGSAAGYIRKFRVHVYFVSGCADASCSGSSRMVPTLKRAELTSVGGATAWRITPLVEGIENLQVEYAIDSAPTAINAATGYPGDGAVDSFAVAPTAPSVWSNVVALRLFVLARNLELTAGYRDDVVHRLYRSTAAVNGASNILATNDAFKRHVFEMEVPLVNALNRRLIPPAT